jgi:hypothetical protein
VNEEEAVADKVEANLDSVNAEDETALDALENETNKLDASGSDADLNLEKEIRE